MEKKSNAYERITDHLKHINGSIIRTERLTSRDTRMKMWLEFWLINKQSVILQVWQEASIKTFLGCEVFIQATEKNDIETTLQELDKALQRTD